MDTPIYLNWEDAPVKYCQQQCRGLWALEDGTDIHVMTVQNSGRYAYHKFSTSTDTWTVRDSFVISSGTVESSAASNYFAVCLQRRSDGDLIVGYQHEESGTGDGEIHCARLEGGTWTTGQEIFNLSGINFRGATIVPGTSDRMHFFSWEWDLEQCRQRTLRSDNSLETMPSAFDTDADWFVSCSTMFGRGLLNGTTVKAPYRDNSNKVSYAELTSADSPTVSVNPDVSDNTASIWENTGVAHACVLDGSNEYLIYTNSTNGDIYWDLNDGTDAEKIVGTYTGFSANKINDGADKIGLLLVGGGVTGVEYQALTL
jgi:hypothetical protein